MQALPVADLSSATLPRAAWGYTLAQTARVAPFPGQRLARQSSARGDLGFYALPHQARPQANTQHAAPGRRGPEQWAGSGGWAPDGLPVHVGNGLLRQAPDLGL